MSIFSIVTQEQISKLEKTTLKPDFKFFFALFFKSRNHSRESLLRQNKCVLYVDTKTVHAGNLDNIPSNWQRLEYNEFVNHISI